MELVNTLPAGLAPEPFAPTVPVDDGDRTVSRHVSLHADLLLYDVRQSDGATEEELVVLLQDGLCLYLDGNTAFPVPDVPADPGALETEHEDQGAKGLNYRSEPIGGPRWLRLPTPATPTWRVRPGASVVLHLVTATDKPRGHSFTVHGHTWPAWPHAGAASPRTGAVSALTTGTVETLRFTAAAEPGGTTPTAAGRTTGACRRACGACYGSWRRARQGPGSRHGPRSRPWHGGRGAPRWGLPRWGSGHSSSWDWSGWRWPCAAGALGAAPPSPDDGGRCWPCTSPGGLRYAVGRTGTGSSGAERKERGWEWLSAA